MDIITKYNIDYAHFDNEQITDQFIDYLKTINITISLKCCNGKGVGITNKYTELNDIITNFWDLIPKETCIMIDTLESCSVCYELTSKAINCDKPHVICDQCFEQIKECPICRRCLIK